MSEIEKMYENANIKQNRMCEWTCKDNDLCNANCEHYESTQLYYPPFTAEKQLELIKWLANYERFCCWKFKPTNEWVIYDDTYMVDGRDIANSDFEECLASYCNNLWQDLTPEEKQQVRRILE